MSNLDCPFAFHVPMAMSRCLIATIGRCWLPLSPVVSGEPMVVQNVQPALAPGVLAGVFGE